MPEFSVIIPLYNKKDVIERAISSVQEQTFTDFELLVIDDGSTDGSVGIVAEITDTRLKIITKKNGGVASARNFGIRNAKSDLIAFLDADDSWSPNFLGTIHKLAKQHPQAGAYATGYKIVQPDGIARNASINGIPNEEWHGIIPDFFESAYKKDLILTASSICIRKKVFAALGNGFSEDTSFAEDLDLWIRIALRFPIAFDTKTSATCYRDVIDRRGNRTLPVQEELPFEAILTQAIDEKILAPRSLIYARELIARHVYLLSVRYLLSGDLKTARQWVLRVKTKLLLRAALKYLLLLLTVSPQSIRNRVGSFLIGRPVGLKPVEHKH